MVTHEDTLSTTQSCMFSFRFLMRMEAENTKVGSVLLVRTPHLGVLRQDVRQFYLGVLRHLVPGRETVFHQYLQFAVKHHEHGFLDRVHALFFRVCQVLLQFRRRVGDDETVPVLEHVFDQQIRSIPDHPGHDLSHALRILQLVRDLGAVEPEEEFCSLCAIWARWNLKKVLDH